MQDTVSGITRAVRHVLNAHEWADTFRANGLNQGQGHVRRGILRDLEWDAEPAIPSHVPSWEQFESIFPRGTDIPLLPLLTPFIEGGVGAAELTARTPVAPIVEAANDAASMGQSHLTGVAP